MKTPVIVVSSLLLWSMTAISGQDRWFEDPFATRHKVRQSPGVSQFSEHDACQQNRSADQAWTLVDVVDQALCHSPQTRQAWANARFQAGQVGIAKAAYLPTLTWNTSISRSKNSSSSNLQINTIGSSGGAGAQPINRYTPVVSLNYLLYNFGAREAQLENAEKVLEASNWTHDAVLQTVMFAAIQAYYQVFATQSAAEAAQVSEQASDESLKAAQKRYEVGTVALADSLLAKTALAQARLARQKAEGDARIAKGTLANVLGLEADYAMTIAEPSVPKPDGEQENYVHELIEEAKTLRPDLAAAEATVKAAEANVKAAEAGHLPSLSLIGNYGYNHTSLPSDTQSWTIGMQVSVPLFTGFNQTYQIQNAKEQLEVKRANFDQLEQSVSLDVWRAYQLLNTAQESFKSSEELLTSATQSERVAMGRYQTGTGTIIDLMNAQASHANARLQLIQSQYNWLTQKAQLAQALGRLDFSTLSEK